MPGKSSMQKGSSFQRSFLNATFAMVAFGVIAASVSDPTVMSLVMLGGTVPGVLGAYYWTVLRGHRPLAGWAANLISTLGFFLAFYAALQWFSTLLPFLHFLSIVQCLKLWQEKKTRDYAHLFIVSVVQVASGSSISLDLQFGVFFLFYLFVAFWALVLFYLKREADRGTGFYLSNSEPQRMEQLSAREVKACFRTGVLAMMGLVALVTLSLFLTLPRYRVQVLNVQAPGATRAMVGFSKNVRLGQIGEIKDNSQVVMRVRLTRGGEPVEANGFPLLWRGVSTDLYEYGNWRINEFPGLRLYWRAAAWRTNRSGWFDRQTGRFLGVYGRLAWPPVPNSTQVFKTDIRQEITLEPLGTDVIFSLYHPLRYLMPDGAKEVSLDTLHWNVRFDARAPRLSYVVYSRPFPLRVSRLNQAGLNPRGLIQLQRTYFMQVPDNLKRDGRLAELARSIARRAKAGTPYQTIQAIRLWLEENCKYTRLPGVLKRKPTDDPILAFLFKTRKGHCEYFATAQALLTRSLGIPARVVNGFRGGEWNDLGRFYLVRQSNAHSWTEAYLDGVGWFPVDPSPREEDSRLAFQSGVFQETYSYLQSLWDRSVISYRPGRLGFASNPFGNLLFDLQAKAMRSVPGLSMEGSEDIQSLLGKAAVAFATLASFSLGLLLVFRGLKLFSAWIFATEEDRPEKSRVRFYDDLLALLKKQGYRRSPYQTPAEFAESFAYISDTAYARIQELTHIYYQCRYAGQTSNAAFPTETRTLLAEIRRALRLSTNREESS